LANQIALHSILSFTHEDYGRATSVHNIKEKVFGPSKTIETVPEEYYDIPTSPESNTPKLHRANATLLMLARNSDLENAMRSMRRLEDRFNRHYKYPWTFLNEVPFTDEFKQCVHFTYI
jgi:alpha 1,2-mannosyltransferase